MRNFLIAFVLVLFSVQAYAGRLMVFCDPVGADVKINGNKQAECKGRSNPAKLFLPKGGEFKVEVFKFNKDGSYLHDKESIFVGELGDETVSLKGSIKLGSTFYYRSCMNGVDGACNTYISKYPNGKFISKVKAKRTKFPKADFVDKITGMEFVPVKGDCYQMGSNKGETNEKPVHEVCFDDFYIGKYEVTQSEWQKVMGNNPSKFSSCGPDCPVEYVTWDDAQDFIRKLNSRSSVTFRLPTEAEWEYAAKGGENHKYSGSDNADAVAWYKGNSGKKTHRVGTKQANGFGLYDMSGNVLEWVEDMFFGTAYSQHQRNNPMFIDSSLLNYRVARGGEYYDPSDFLSPTYRLDRHHSSKSSLGFRLVRDVK
jgi:formylglycine-generating enzyme required for sulfatase activity